MTASANGQSEPGSRPRIEPAAEQAREPRMPYGLLGELLSRCFVAGGAHPRRSRIRTRHEVHGDAGGESEEEEDEEGHWLGVRLPSGAPWVNSGMAVDVAHLEQPRPVEPTARAIEDRRDGSWAPLLEPTPGGRPSDSPPPSARDIRFASFWRPSSVATRCSLGLTIAVGFLLTRVILKIDGVAAWDEHVSRAIVRERTDTTVDLSWVGSTLAGGLVIPALVGVLLVVFLVSEALAARRVHAVRDLRRVGHLPRQRASSSTATGPT